MLSSSHRKLERLLNNRSSRRGLMLAGAALALGGITHPPVLAAERQGPGSLKLVDAASGGTPLARLLGMVPAAYIDQVESNGIDWQYDDLARQFASLGLHHDSDGPDFDNEPVSNATFALSRGSSVFNFVQVEELINAIGFQPFGMDQSLAVGAPGRRLNMFRGGFDPDRLIEAWSLSGYQPYDTASGIPAWTLGADGELDIDHPVQHYLIFEFDNVAIIDDVLVYSSRKELLELALSFVGSGEASMADHPVYAPLIDALPETTVSAVGVSSTQLDIASGHFGEQQLEAIESRIAEAIDQTGSMPAMTGLVSAVNEGATIADFEWQPEGSQAAEERADAGTAFVRIGTGSEPDATRAADIVAERWETFESLITNVPYIELATIEEYRARGDVAALDLRQALHPRLWLDLFVNQDVLPFVADPS